jgi:serine/threonine protein kinase
MGEVYLATQSNLGRQVAIKVLASEATSDSDRVRRFEQEARAASALNHPNIISIYDVGRENSTAYIVMEFVDGRTLRALLESGQLPIKKTLQIAVQIADGLAKAHAAGIVHRDLKPENIMVTRDGFVKILDFGLAKLVSRFDSTFQNMTATVDSHPGAVLGTAGYMSPEQARGEPVDYRADIFSLGSILYEMITGKQPFRRDSTAQTLAAIIEDDPQSLAELNAKSPTPLRWVIDRCLAKDPGERYSSTLDLARDLKNVRDHLTNTTTSGTTADAHVRPKSSKWAIPVACAISGVILGVVLALWLKPQRALSSPSVHAITFSGNDFSPSVSPDGHTVAFVSGRDGTFRIWLKQVDSGSETVLTPGADDSSPRFSPDGAWVLFIRDRAAYRIPSIGGEPRKLIDDIEDAGWSPDGRQLAFVRFEGRGTKIGVASLEDGTSRVTREVESVHLHSPAWSPDGKAIALIPQFAGTVDVVHAVFLVSPDGRDFREIKCPVPGGSLSSPAWVGSKEVVYGVPESPGDVDSIHSSNIGSAGHVILQDVKSGEVRILLPIPAPASRIEIAGSERVIFDSLTQRGNLRFFSNSPDVPSGGRWLTRGNSIDRQPYFSPDGGSVVFSSSRGGDVDVWEASLKTGALRRLTDHPALDYDPFISPDNRHLLWSSNRSGHFEIWIAERDGSSPRQISQDGFDAENPVVTPDGWVIYASGQPQHPGLYKVRLDGTDTKLVVPGPAAWPDVSPDGKYILFHTASGALQARISVTRFPEGTPVGFETEGLRARFSADGRSIVYIRNGGRDIVRQDFLSGANSSVRVLVPGSPDFITESLGMTRDSKNIVASYVQPSRSLVVADRVLGLSESTGTK